LQDKGRGRMPEHQGFKGDEDCGDRPQPESQVRTPKGNHHANNPWHDMQARNEEELAPISTPLPIDGVRDINVSISTKVGREQAD
jgi:hypothetical protein